MLATWTLGAGIEGATCWRFALTGLRSYSLEEALDTFSWVVPRNTRTFSNPTGAQRN